MIDLRRKISAFTMMDLMTGMVIMSIIIAIIFYLISSTNQQVMQYSRSRSDIIAYRLLKEDLNRQVENANRVEQLPNGFRVITRNKTIFYTLENRFLLRKDGAVTDTLFSNVESVKTVFNAGAEINPNKEIINRILINLFIGKKELKLYIYKSYTSQDLINFQMLDEY